MSLLQQVVFLLPTIFRFRYFCPPPHFFVQSDQSSQSVQEQPGGLQSWPQASISLSEPLQGIPPHFEAVLMERCRIFTPLQQSGQSRQSPSTSAPIEHSPQAPQSPHSQSVIATPHSQSLQGWYSIFFPGHSVQVGIPTSQVWVESIGISDFLHVGSASGALRIAAW